jgi:hypothetical protein
MQIEDGTLSTREKIDVTLRDDGWIEAAALIPDKGEGTVGRPRTYPRRTWTLWSDLRDIWESHTAVERELGRGGWWRYIRREDRRLHPDLPPLPPKPPRRQAFEYVRDTYLATNEAIARAAEIHTRVAVRKAKEAGNLDPDGGGSFTHPMIERSLYGDGKVVSALYKAKPGDTVRNRETGEVRALRFDPDAGSHTEGGGDIVYGTKFAFLSTRRAEGRFILGIEHVEKDKNETIAMLEILRRIREHDREGMQALVYDMAVRGTHVQLILTEIGIVPVVQVHAKKNPERKEGRRKGTYIPKIADLDDIEVRMPDGTPKIAHIAAHDGAAAVKELTEAGEPHYELLECVRIQRHTDKNTYRWYGYFRLPEEYGGQIIPIRLHQTEDDDRRKINRTENLRPIPEGSEDFDRLRVLRPDAESINRGVEDVLYINRASAKGWRRQMVDLLGHARLVSAITLARCRVKKRLDIPA